VFFSLGAVSLSSLVSPPLPFASPEAGFDYFATQAHYWSLANRIITALGGFNVVVLTGDPPPDAPMLSTALSVAAARRHRVIAFSCGPEQGRHGILDLRRALSASLTSGGATGEEPALPMLILFDGADRLSDRGIEEIFQQVHQRAWIGDHRIGAAVFLTGPEFLTQLEHPVLRFWLAKRLVVARLRFRELGADEIATFIRHQLPPENGESAFADEAVAAIANVSGGDPVLVNRFAGRMLESVVPNTGDALVKATVRSTTMMPTNAPSEEWGVETFEGRRPQNPMPTQLSTRAWHDRGVTLKLCAGAVFCLACVGGLAAVVHMRPAEENMAAFSSAPAKDAPAKVSERGSLADAPQLQEADAAASVAPPAEPAPNAAIAVAAPTPEEALATKTPALSPLPAVLRPTTEVMAPTAALERTQSTAIPAEVVSPTAGTSVSTAVSPTGTQEPKPTTSTPGPPPTQQRLPTAEISVLLTRGDTLLALGDIASARLFYERAAEVGNGRAALKLGKTFDPVFLNSVHLRVRGDVAMAGSWYARALELGEAEAEILLKRLGTVSSR
jgi:hypothetical protein